MKTYLIILLLFVFKFTFAQNEEKFKTGTPINSGFVFIDGKYVEPPYNVDIVNNTIFINNVQAYKTYKEVVKPIILVIEEDPGLPPDSILTWEDYLKYKRLNSKHTFNSEKIIYYYTKYPPEKAKSKMREFLLNLPYVINGSSTKGGYITFQRANGEVYGLSWKKFADEIINQKNKSTIDNKDVWKSILKDHQNSIINKLDAGGTVLWSNTKELISLHYIGDSASSALFFNELVQLTMMKNFNSDTVSQKLYKLGFLSSTEYEGKLFIEFINAFSYSANFIKRLDELRNHYLSKYGKDWNNKIMKNKKILLKNLKQFKFIFYFN